MSDKAIVMGFDFGTTRIGIAIGQKITATANPLTVISAREGKPDWDALDKLVSEWEPQLFVVGLPLNMDDSMSDMAAAASKFARRLTGRYNLKAEMMDERLSTFEARQYTDDKLVDAMAARLILESWLNN
jgi:putative Holliday junction resolvase